LFEEFWTVLSLKIRPERRRDKPLVAPLVFHAALPVSVRLVLRFQDRFRAGSNGLSLHSVAILHIHVDHCRLAALPLVGLTYAHNRVADADLRVDDVAF